MSLPSPASHGKLLLLIIPCLLLIFRHTLRTILRERHPDTIPVSHSDNTIGGPEMLDSNYYILNRHPQKFAEMRIAGKAAVFTDASGKVLDYGVLALGSSVYAALYCDEVQNITFVIDRGGQQDVVTLLWLKEDDYKASLEKLRSILSLHFSPQNKKLNRYAEAVAEKLSLGVKLRITDAVSAADMVECPECGMLNPAGSQYCLDCGAEIE